MNRPAIRVEGLGKRYRIGARRKASAFSLRNTLHELVAAPAQHVRHMFMKPSDEELIWALRDVSFDVVEGEVVGVIGHNGAGKSTLLKILSRITEPTAGRAEVRGRLGSLLEVGSGFHPELTGRENVFLNGAILGMRRAEVQRNFDEIVAFAEVEKFIDTPIKRYSTGMFVRLAFAVAAHLETEILLVDEVLSVGDAEFQEKCLGKMGSVARQGRTVFMVSHVLPMVETLCQRSLLLADGRLAMDGGTTEVIEHYLATTAANGEEDTVHLSDFPRSAGSAPAIHEAWLENSKGVRGGSFSMGEPLRIRFRYRLPRPLRNPGFGFGIEGTDGRRIFSLNNYMLSREPVVAPSEGVCTLTVPEARLQSGKYLVSLSVVDNQSEHVDYVERALCFTITARDVYGTGQIPTRTQGLIYVDGRIDVE